VEEKQSTNQPTKQTNQQTHHKKSLIFRKEGIDTPSEKKTPWPLQRSMAMVPKDAKKKLFFTSTQDQVQGDHG